MNQLALRFDHNIGRGRETQFQVDGEPVLAYEGESIGAALTAAGRRVLRRTAKGDPRGIFCGIGLCYDCMVNLDGRNVRACVTPVREGMTVTTIQLAESKTEANDA